MYYIVLFLYKQIKLHVTLAVSGTGGTCFLTIGQTCDNETDVARCLWLKDLQLFLPWRDFEV